MLLLLLVAVGALPLPGSLAVVSPHAGGVLHGRLQLAYHVAREAQQLGGGRLWGPGRLGLIRSGPGEACQPAQGNDSTSTSGTTSLAATTSQLGNYNDIATKRTLECLCGCKLGGFGVLSNVSMQPPTLPGFRATARAPPMQATPLRGPGRTPPPWRHSPGATCG